MHPGRMVSHTHVQHVPCKDGPIAWGLCQVCQPAAGPMGPCTHDEEGLVGGSPPTHSRSLSWADKDGVCAVLQPLWVCFRGRCSVLIKVTPDFQDLLLGHVTWWTYTGMTRLYKHYNFDLHGEQYNTRLTSMSSYPGARPRAAQNDIGLVAYRGVKVLIASVAAGYMRWCEQLPDLLQSCCVDLISMHDSQRACSVSHLAFTAAFMTAAEPLLCDWTARHGIKHGRFLHPGLRSGGDRDQQRHL
jgi:hypothetical protein